MWIETSFFCDYGLRSEINMQLLTAFHPLHSRDRITPDWTPESDL